MANADVPDADSALTDAAPAAILDSGGTPVSWNDCGDGSQCGRVRVPLDYARPYGRRIEIALIRRPALEPQGRIGSLFVHPGGAGLGFIYLRLYPPEFFQAFSRFDVVSFDVRGLGRSAPAVVACGNNPGNVKPYPRPRSTDNRAFAAVAEDYVDRCRARNGELLAHIGTPNMARDLERLRVAVGDPALNYLGMSFGSVVGANYATVDQRWPRGSLQLYFDIAALAYEQLPHLFFAIGYPHVAHALWPVRDRAAFRGRIRNPGYAAPILVVSSTHDAAAPYTRGQALVRDLGHARLLTRDAVGHGAILNSCVLDYAVRHFDAGELPPRGTVCPQDDDPFQPIASGAVAVRRAATLPAPHEPY